MGSAPTHCKGAGTGYEAQVAASGCYVLGRVMEAVGLIAICCRTNKGLELRVDSTCNWGGLVLLQEIATRKLSGCLRKAFKRPLKSRLKGFKKALKGFLNPV